MIRSRNIQKWVFTGEISSGRITRDVRMKRMRHGWKGVILHCGFFSRFPYTLIMNDGTGWLHNKKSINSMILVHNKCGIRNGRSQDSKIRRINRTWGRRLRERIHMTTNRLASQLCADIKSRWGGRMFKFNRCVCMISHITMQWWSCLMR